MIKSITTKSAALRGLNTAVCILVYSRLKNFIKLNSV